MTPGLRRFFSIAIWTLAASAALFLWSRSDENGQTFQGLVQPKTHRLSTPITTILRTVHIRPGQQVERDQPMYELDTGDLDDQLTIARAELEEMLASLDAQAESVKTRLTEQRLELNGRLTNAQNEYNAAASKRAGDSAEIRTLTRRLTRLAEVEQAGLAELDRLSQIHVRRDRLTKTTRSTPSPSRVYGDYIDALSNALQSLEVEDVAVQLKPYRLRLLTQRARISTLERQRALRTVRSPAAGQIVRVHNESGDTVRPGVTIVDLVASRSGSLIAYIPERAARQVGLGSRVKIESIDSQGRVGAHGKVVQLGQQIAEMPQRLWPRPGAQTYGRSVHIEVDGVHGLLPGELVTIRRTSQDPQAATAPRDDGVTLVVPTTLEAQSRLEISGALWIPERNKYLVVSDDTGHKAKNSGIPWLFEVSADGAVSPTPIPIEGVASISDLEAIARGPQGQLYLMSSQSVSKKGKRPTRRQLLIRGHLAGGTFKVTGQVHLYSLLEEQLGASKLAELGISESLDIEGIAWMTGTLLVGLKAPFIQENRARIWAIENPDTLFAPPQGSREAIRIRLFSDLYLPTGSNDRPGGISDLMVRGETLYALSTVPTGAPAGAAWRIELTAPTKATKIGQWDMLKPEAIATHRSDQLTVFFDRGGQHPMMTVIKP